jgi:hypothetical protein
VSKRRNRKNDLDADTPYWKNAHTDWRFQVAVGLMLIAIAVYVLSGDLTWLPHF